MSIQIQGDGDNWDPAREEERARSLADLLKPHFDAIRAAMPPDTDFGLLLGLGDFERGEGRVIAMTTDLDRVARLAVGWLMQSGALETGE